MGSRGMAWEECGADLAALGDSVWDLGLAVLWGVDLLVFGQGSSYSSLFEPVETCSRSNVCFFV